MDIETFQKNHTDYQRFLPRFNTLQSWMYGDLKRASVNAQANFLVAMGVFSYIEILGSFYKYKGSLTSRFNFVINQLFNDSYKNEIAKIKRVTGKDIYNIIRSGLTHEYLIKTYEVKDGKKLMFTVVGSGNERDYEIAVNSETCGIKLIRNGNLFKIYIINARLIEDFHQACGEYKRRLNEDRRNYRQFLIRRCRNINFQIMPI